MKVFSTFLHEWRLAILFIVAGAGSYFALGFLSGRQFVLMRFKRIVIPLVMGTLLIVPVHIYYWQFLGNPGYGKSYLQFYATILEEFVRNGNFGRGRESLHWGHLWFLAYLFVSSLVALPLFLFLRRGNGQHLIPRLAAFVEKRWAIFLFAIPIVLVEVTLRARWAGRTLVIVDDWATFFFYLVLFIYGFVIFSNDRIRRAIERHRKSALIAGIMTSLAYLIITFATGRPVRGYNLNWTLFMVLRGFNVWFWCVAILGFGSKHLDFKNKVLPYANEAVYPVYILHLPIATMIAYQVVRWPIGVFAQFAIIVVSTLTIAVLIFEIIKRTKVTRFLFGLKLKKPKQEKTAPLPSAIPSSETTGSYSQSQKATSSRL